MEKFANIKATRQASPYKETGDRLEQKETPLPAQERTDGAKQPLTSLERLIEHGKQMGF